MASGSYLSSHQPTGINRAFLGKRKQITTLSAGTAVAPIPKRVRRMATQLLQRKLCPSSKDTVKPLEEQRHTTKVGQSPRPQSHRSDEMEAEELAQAPGSALNQQSERQHFRATRIKITHKGAWIAGILTQDIL